MPYLFTCPHCQAQTQVEDRYSGQAGECFSCGHPIQVPDFAETGSSDTIAAARRPLGVLIAAGVILTLLVCLGLLVISFGGSSVSRLAEARKQAASLKNLERIAAALNAYAADNGSYPPTVLRDADGRPLHSWRVLILPYLEQQELYDEFDLSLPWDHEANMQAGFSMPEVYRHPAERQPGRGQSGYYLITGPGTLFPDDGPLSPDQITDPTSQTILVIGSAPPADATAGLWTEPIDLDFAKMRGVIGGTRGIEPGGQLASAVTMATVDQRGHVLNQGVSPEIFNALVTPRGEEPLPDDTLD